LTNARSRDDVFRLDLGRILGKHWNTWRDLTNGRSRDDVFRLDLGRISGKHWNTWRDLTNARSRDHVFRLDLGRISGKHRNTWGDLTNADALRGPFHCGLFHVLLSFCTFTTRRRFHSLDRIFHVFNSHLHFSF
jgi:hypothetical protein